MKSFILRIFFFVILVSCSTTRDYLGNGKKYYDNELYYKALEELSLGVKKDPNNPDLNIALKKTQDKVFELELLKVRDTREAGDPLKALEQVREVDRKMDKWNITTNINGSKFRKAEVNRLFFNFKSYVDSFIDKNQILKAHVLLKSYSDILSSLDSYNTLMGDIRSKGQEKCELLKKNQMPFFNKFIANYCDFFGQAHNIKYDVSEYKYNFKRAFVNNEISYNYLENSPLVSVNSPNYLSSTSNVDFDYKEIKTNPKKSVNYTDRESYWDNVTKTTWVTEYYWTTELVCNYLNKWNPCQNKKVKKSRVVPRYRKERVKKYRRVNKTYTYRVENIEQISTLKGMSTIYIKGNAWQKIKHNHRTIHSDYGHDKSFSKAGVKPKNLRLKDKKTLEQDLIYKMGKDIRAWLENRWSQEYCVKKGNLMLQGEFVMRCSLVDEKHKEVKAWSVNFTGLSFIEVKKILNL